MSENKNYFKDLARIDVTDYAQDKNGFTYLSWAWAIDQLKQKHPDAIWEFKKFEDADGNKMPFMKTDAGYFVEVEVTVNGITHSSIQPVLDYRNKAMSNPNAFDINKSLQRCLVKAIAMHGLGLYIYAGEDLPTIPEDEVTDGQINTIKTLVKEFAGLRKRPEKDVYKALKISDIEQLSEGQADQILDVLANWIKKAKNDDSTSDEDAS